ncbi:hypothetical protein BKA65DRAFT_481363 [Rhexocercosporidium sp. MPI-PUGE-AT-0058]|nr:hypothetical protein BKA65DRAFT_481363 [Rhexocercosporidium sp. MPI-PUGE-AT-0058]
MTRKPRDAAKSILIRLPIELRYMIYSEIVKHRTIYIGEVERFSNRKDTNTRVTINCSPGQQFHTTKSRLLAIRNIGPDYICEIHKWLRGVPWLRSISWCDYFDPKTAVFVTDGRSRDIRAALSSEVFRRTAQHVLLDTRGTPTRHWDVLMDHVVFDLRGLTALKRFDIRCNRPLDDWTKLVIMWAICHAWRLCWKGCSCARGGCDERRPVVRWQIPNRRCGRGKWMVLPWIEYHVWRWVVYGWADVTEDEKTEVVKLKACGRLSLELHEEPSEIRHDTDLSRLELQVKESKRRLRAWKIRLVSKFFLGENNLESPSDESVNWGLADAENERREEERRQEERMLKIGREAHMRALIMETSKGHIRLQMGYSKGQRLKGRWQVGSAR